MDVDDSYGSRMSWRAVGGVLAAVVAGCGVSDVVVADVGASAAAPTRLIAPLADASARLTARPHLALRTSPEPQTVWVSADAATVWIKPRKARAVDALALRARPRITQWIRQQTLRQRLDLDTRVMTQALHGDALTVITRRDGWSKVRLPDQFGSGFPNGIVGWVPTRQLTLRQPSHPVLRADVRRHGTGADALRLAHAYLGTRYLWGGMTALGIDCSGLTYRVYRQLGVVLPRDAADQSRVGRHVNRHALRPGDLVFFGSQSWQGVHHVGIYAGHGWLLHAPHTGTVVQFTRLRAFPDYWGARRIL